METVKRIRLRFTPKQREVFFLNEDKKFKIVRKGRRAGITHGAALAYIKWMIKGIFPLLWVDTINGNIDRYFERYFEPCLRENKIEYTWNLQKKVLKIGEAYCDFRSADAPESIEGFGYKKIFLNEAGIILKNNYLYTNALLPMLMDFPESQLIAAGVPKGKVTKSGDEHIFYKLYQKGLEDDTYQNYQLSSYDNPLLNAEDIKQLEDEIAVMDEQMVLQEIHAEFIEASGTRPFATRYEKPKHESLKAIYQEDKPIFVSLDFNLNPFGFIFSHIWQDKDGFHRHQFDEATIEDADLEQGIDYIKEYYGDKIHSITITGDKMGDRRDFGRRDRASYYMRLERGLKLRKAQIKTYANPMHSNSKDQVNYLLTHHPDWIINPETCPNTCRDMRTVQVDAFNSLLKKNRNDANQRADHLDCVRYETNAFFFEWIKRHQKGHYRK